MHPEKANRLAEFVEEVRRAFRDAVAVNPWNRMDTAVDTVPMIGFPNTTPMPLRDDGRVEVAEFDWSEDVKVINSAACVRLNVSAA